MAEIRWVHGGFRASKELAQGVLVDKFILLPFITLMRIAYAVCSIKKEHIIDAPCFGK